jgi:membrane fusion protein
MRQELFRREALDFSREQTFGDAIAVRSLSFSLLTIIFVALAAAMVAFAAFAEYTRKAHVTGYLAPNFGLIKIYAPESGILIEKQVSEGKRVKQGDPLFVLSTERSSRDTAQAQAAAIDKLKQRRRSLEKELAKQGTIDQIQFRSTQERIRGMAAEIAQLSSEIAIQQQRVASAASSVARFEKLLAEKFVSEAQTQQKNEELLEQKAWLSNLQRSRVALERDANALKRELTSGDLKAGNQRSAIQREIVALEQELTEHESRRTIVITTPSDGVVTTILAERGQSANPQNPLLSIVPSGARMQAQLLVPSPQHRVHRHRANGGAALSGVSLSALRQPQRARNGNLQKLDRRKRRGFTRPRARTCVSRHRGPRRTNRQSLQPGHAAASGNAAGG